MRSAGKTAITISAVVALAAGTTGVATAQQPGVAADSVRGSIAYLVDRYGVSQAEALRRLDLQRVSSHLDKLFKTAFPDNYAGMRIDQDGGGVLRVSFKDPSAATGALADVADRAHVTTERVEHSLADLTAARDRVAQEVDAGPLSAYLPAISQAENRVVLWEREWVAQDTTRLDSPARAGASAAAEADAARRAVAADPGVVVARTLVEPKPLAAQVVDPDQCHPLSCLDQGPMRGGIRLNLKRDNGTWGGCTVGYNVRSSGGGFAGKPWVLTAGHCMATKTNNTPTQHHGVDVVAQHGIEKNSYPYDYAAVPYVDDATAQEWLEGHSERNLVLKCEGVGGCDTPSTQQITTVHPLADIIPGWVVCAAGSGSSAADHPAEVDSGAGAGYQPGTHCGQVLSTDVGINTDVCARAGDSGGPLFTEVDRAGLGILEGSQQERSGPCAPGELNNYSPLDTILTDLGERVASQGSVFSVITSPQG
ncbi:trypsin-like serine protease [Umezawaea sp.]|uniref:trypsin-like serine protease n=1 Tax=Umezawaea sp. TaxID=1955258 RepID=UPI002ED63634